jgi:hypothetical protein
MGGKQGGGSCDHFVVGGRQIANAVGEDEKNSGFPPKLKPKAGILK